MASIRKMLVQLNNMGRGDDLCWPNNHNLNTKSREALLTNGARKIFLKSYAIHNIKIKKNIL